MPTSEDVYNEYKMSEEKEVVIEGQVYYKIIYIYKIAEYNLIMLPDIIFSKKVFFEEENGNFFELGSTLGLHMSHFKL